MSLGQIERYAVLLGLPESTLHVAKGSRDNTKIIEYFQKVRSDLCSDVHIPEITQWLNVSQAITVSDITFLNTLLIARTFIRGNKIGLEDVVVYDSLVQNSTLFNTALAQPNVSRWIEHLSYNLNTTRTAVVKAPTLLPFLSIHSFEDVGAAAQTPEAPTAPSSSDKEAAASKKTAKQEEKEKTKKAKAGKDETATSTPAPAAAPIDEADPSKLDIRVGVVLNCWIHPDSEKLLCEEIDVGEETPRRIGSGIRAFYQPEQLVGRKVFVLANLKERSLAGFPSQVHIYLI